MTAFEEMKVVELRAELKSRGLPVGGLKAALIQRLQDYDKPADAAQDGRPDEEEQEEGDQEQEQEQEPEPEPEPEEKSTAGVTKPAKASVKAAAAAAAGEEKAASPAESEKEGAAVTAVTAAAPEARGTSAAAAPELKSTRSKTRRASMAAAVATTTKSPATAAAVPVKAPVVEATAAATEPAERGDGGGGSAGAAAAAAVATAGAEAVDENSEMQIMLAEGAGLLGLGISAACIGWGDGLTAGNLAMLHVALAGLFMAATAANTRPPGARAFAARAIVMLAVALVASGALSQVQQPAQAAPAAGARAHGGMASLLSLVSGAEGKAPGCENSVAAAGEDDGVAGDVACLEAAEAPLTALEALLAWVTSAWSVLEGGDWRAVRFGVIEFWGWASVAGYVTLVEALPVMLQPLHGVFRRLERGHNILLAVTSLAMLVGIIRSCVTSGKTDSVHAMLCGPFDEQDPVFDLTSKVFFWSKAWEWFDTALLVAKGKPVSWLQYTHHASTAILTALNMVPMRNAMWSVVCSLNSFVHTWMYAYYGLPRFRLLRRSKVWLTWAQMLQHMVVLASATYVVYLGHTGAECHNNTTPMLAGLGLYGMYLAFFALFYRRTYGGAGTKSKGKNKSKAA